MKSFKNVLTVTMMTGLMLFMSACSGGGAGSSPTGDKSDAGVPQETGTETEVASDSAQDTDSSAAAEEITINYQSSIGYAPLLVMRDLKLIESEYSGDIKVNWVEMSNGAEVNEALISGSLDVGSMGVPVAVTGIMAGSPYKIAFGLAAQPYAILSNKPEIKKLSDIGPEDQIAITNINSQPHILLAMAAKKELGDARALDANLTKLGNADGYAAMLSGAVPCQMVISPYNFMETSNKEVEIHELDVDPSVWPKENTALVSVVPEKLKNEKPEVYAAILAAVDKADQYISEHPKETADILSEGYDATPDEILEWMQDERSSYSTELKGVMNMAGFMVEEGFLDEGPSSIADLVYEGVKGD